MSRRGGRGKVSHKGRRRHFTDEEDLKQDLEKAKREQEWRERRGEVPSDDEGDNSNEDSSSEEEGNDKKGVSALIEIENPNRVKQKMKKVTDISVDGESSASSTQLSRREREEIAKQQEKIRYQKLHAQGKTDQAKADLARLAIIRKEREDAARKRQEEKEAREKAAGSKGGK